MIYALVVSMICAVAGTTAAFYAQGYRVWVVHTGSMEPTYMPGDVVVDAPPSGHYHVGEVLTFRHSDLTSDVVTHRVTAVTPDGTIHTKGDANRTADVWDIRPDQVQGRTIGKITHLGYVLVFLRQPTGAAAFAAVIFAIVMLWQLFFPANRASTDPASSRHRLTERGSATVS